MSDTLNTGTMLIGEGALIPGFLRFESEPWTFFHMAGEMIRKLRKAPEHKASTGAKATSGDGPKAPERPGDGRRDEEASSRMDDEGCLHERTATPLDARRYSRIGGRLHLVGSPIF